MRGHRTIAGALTLAGALWLGGVSLAARHEVGAGDPAGVTSARGWVDYRSGDARVGHQLDVRPPAGGTPSGPGQPPGAPPSTVLTPFLEALVGVPLDPSRWYVPPMEAPTVDDGPHLPDLLPAPAWAVYVDETFVGASAADSVLATVNGEDLAEGSRKAIRFGTTIINRGRHSLEVVGAPQPSGDAEDPIRVDARQCVRFAGARLAGAERTCVEYKPVGALAFHVQHGHFHIDGFAQYRLLRDHGGRPNEQAVVSRSEKVGFCMGDTDWLGKGELVVDMGWYRECRHTTPHVPVTFRQGVSPDWGDSYGPDLPGQHLVIEGVPDGVYWIAITVNPAGVPGAVNLFETNRANNTSYRKLQLLKGGTEVKLL